MKYIATLIIFTFSSVAIQASFDPEDVKSFKEECRNNKKFTSPNYSINCGEHFHHYNNTAKRKFWGRKRSGDIKISHFNALHPGMSKTRFKDYNLVAKMLSKFDIIAVTELIPSMSENLKTNKKVINFARTAPQEIRDRKAIISQLSKLQRSSHSVVRERRINLQRQIIESMKSDLKKLPDVYREPGYLRILNALRSLNDGNNWSLIITATPEGRASNETKELVGYYYKANTVKPIKTPYCADRNLKNGRKAYACHPLFDRKDLGEDKSFILSRRPFMASFKAGKFKTTLISSHSTFESPNLGEEWRAKVLKKAFNKGSTVELPTGINEGNYARFAELQVTLEFVQKRMRSQKNDIVLLGDYNLETRNKFMDSVVSTWSGANIFIDQKTSVKNARYESNSQTPTNGVSSNYDHFIINPKKTKECMLSENAINGDVYNFLNRPKESDLVGQKYKVRIENRFKNGQYEINKRKYNRLISNFVRPLQSMKKPILTIGRKLFTYQNQHTLTAQAIVPDLREMREQTTHFVTRILESQLKNESYYYFYEQVISDHLPIFMRCRIN